MSNLLKEKILMLQDDLNTTHKHYSICFKKVKELEDEIEILKESIKKKDTAIVNMTMAFCEILKNKI